MNKPFNSRSTKKVEEHKNDTFLLTFLKGEK